MLLRSYLKPIKTCSFYLQRLRFNLYTGMNPCHRCYKRGQKNYLDHENGKASCLAWWESIFSLFKNSSLIVYCFLCSFTMQMIHSHLSPVLSAGKTVFSFSTLIMVIKYLYKYISMQVFTSWFVQSSFTVKILLH